MTKSEVKARIWALNFDIQCLRCFAVSSNNHNEKYIRVLEQKVRDMEFMHHEVLNTPDEPIRQIGESIESFELRVNNEQA